MRVLRTVPLALGWLLLLAFAPDPAAAQTCGAAPTLSSALVGQAGCHLSALGLVPLTELGCRSYRGFEGGLYPGGANTPPEEHDVLGRVTALTMRPLDAAGRADDEQGRIGFASIGMSNTSMEFGPFVSAALADPIREDRVVIVDGAQDGRDALYWADPASPVWSILDARLAAAGLTPAQLQGVWMKLALAFPFLQGDFPAHAEVLRDRLADVVRIAKARYPNLRIAHLSSRTRAYNTLRQDLNPEPFAYESGFAVKWLIEQQIAGDPTLRFDPDGPSPAPWLGWGPYLWADGETPRIDGFRWRCSDLASDDFTHPSHQGRQVIGALLLDFARTDPTTSWYRPHGYCGRLGAEPAVALVGALVVRRVRRGPRARA